MKADKKKEKKNIQKLKVFLSKFLNEKDNKDKKDI